MEYREECCNLFDYYDKGYILVQCLSADLVAGAGIAVEFNKRLDMKNRLRQRYPYGVYMAYNHKISFLPTCVYEQRVFNLITKDKVWEKPTYENFELSLKVMRYGIEQLYQKDKNGETALQYASLNGHHQIVEFLVSKGANINEKNKEGRTELHIASCNGEC